MIEYKVVVAGDLEIQLNQAALEDWQIDHVVSLPNGAVIIMWRTKKT